MQQNQCAEIKIRAERKGGEMLRDMPKKHGARPSDAGFHRGSPSLDEVGIEYKQSHRWQHIEGVGGYERQY